MSSLGTKKYAMIGIIAIICVSLLIVASLFPMLNKKTTEQDDDEHDSWLNAQPLTTYQEPVIDPTSNSVNGLEQESWFGGTLDEDTLNLVTENVGTDNFTSTGDEQREGVFGTGEEKAADTGTELDGDNSDDGEPREIEEADIIKLEDDTLYILNTYRGLILVDISNPDMPKIESRVPMFGYPVDMYIVGSRAYVILTHYYNAFLWTEDATKAPEYRHGSEIVIVDISDHSKPLVQKYIELDGFITDSRRVGEVIYAVANNFEMYYGYGAVDDVVMVEKTETETEPEPVDEERTEEVKVEEEEIVYDDSTPNGADETSSSSDPDEESVVKEAEKAEEEEETMLEPQQGTVVVSINMEDLNNIAEMDREWFPGSSNQIHVTEHAIFVAKPEYNYYRDEEFGYEYQYNTEITYVDISDPHGEIKLRDTFKVDGFLEDRYQMDYYENTFRIVTHFWGEWRELGSSKLWIFDTSNPDKITKLGELLIDDAGSLMATRFAGERAYTIHLPYSIDPLDVLDLSNPAKPVLTDVFEMPGWITHMEVRGYKILALGVDDSGDQNKVAVSLFDVTDPYNAEMKDRVMIGEGYSWSTANWDPKALTVVDDQNLILVPFESYSYDEYGKYESFSGLQIVEFDLEKGDLTAGGTIEQIDSVQRTRANEERIFAVSNRLLQVISAEDRAKPKITATLELCNNIVDIIPLDQYCIQVISDFDYRDGKGVMKLRTVPAGEPDSMAYLAEQKIEYNLNRIFINGNYLYIICNDYSYESETNRGMLLVYDYSEPTTPTLKNIFEMKYYNGDTYYGYYYGYYYDGYYNPVQGLSDYSFVQVDDDLIIYHPNPEWDDKYYYAEEGEPVEKKETYEPEPTPDGNSTTRSSRTDGLTEKLYIIDVSNPAEPVDISNVIITNTLRISGMHANGAFVYLTQYEDISSYDNSYKWRYEIKYYITIVDLSIPAEPKVMGPINIPGTFLGASNDGSVVYTRTSEYDEEYNWEQTLNILKMNEDTATLVNAIDLGENYANIVVSDTTILIGYTEYSWGGYYYEDEIYILDGAVPRTDKLIEPVINTKIQIVDAKDPKNVRLKATLGLNNYGNIYKFENNKLYIQLTDANGLLIYDISDLGTPVFLGYYPVQGWINSLRESSTGRIYLACGWYGVLIVDISQ
ncbi:beta-propeller domain-containing protein [[Eubacterium] cellulosolvens]